MAKNKREVDHEVKREQIEDVACELFQVDGYEATSMAAVAKAASVAPNTLYWYFENKDDLLVAVLDRHVNRAIKQLATMQDQSLSTQLRWLLGEFQHASKLMSTVHARLERSEKIRVWHDRFHAMLDQMLVHQMVSKGMSSTKAAVLATVGTYVAEGLLSHPHTPEQVDTMLMWLTGNGKL